MTARRRSQERAGDVLSRSASAPDRSLASSAQEPAAIDLVRAQQLSRVTKAPLALERRARRPRHSASSHSPSAHRSRQAVLARVKAKVRFVRPQRRLGDRTALWTRCRALTEADEVKVEGGALVVATQLLWPLFAPDQLACSWPCASTPTHPPSRPLRPSPPRDSSSTSSRPHQHLLGSALVQRWRPRPKRSTRQHTTSTSAHRHRTASPSAASTSAQRRTASAFLLLLPFPSLALAERTCAHCVLLPQGFGTAPDRLRRRRRPREARPRRQRHRVRRLRERWLGHRPGACSPSRPCTCNRC